MVQWQRSFIHSNKNKVSIDITPSAAHLLVAAGEGAGPEVLLLHVVSSENGSHFVELVLVGRQ